MEEQTCLVRTRSDSESSSKLGSFGSVSHVAYMEEVVTGADGTGDTGNTVTMSNLPPETVDGANGDNGDLLEYNDSSVLEQFHEDALRQAGCGVAQARVLLAVGLALIGSSVELSAISFILPSAEIELCVLPHEKSWLVLISVVGCSIGSFGWGVLADRVGRRRALTSALAVNVVFAAIAAFMPTYGTFMMARFCSAIGSGGIIPAGFTYAGEVIPRQRRSTLLSVLLGAMGLGVLLATLLAGAVLPATGADAVIENKEHFSAWHRYLLLCTLPILASLVSLIWTQESPRFLLEIGREVDAMMVYQSIHTSNQLRICGKANVAAAPSENDYRLGELALPGKRRPPALNHVRHSVKMLWQTFVQLFSGTYRNTTVSLGGTLLFIMAIQFYLWCYIPAAVDRLDVELYRLSRRSVQNVTLEGELYVATLENVKYVGVTFRGCTFRDLILSHVAFINCTFQDVAFYNIKSSRTVFIASQFVNSSIIDTDLEAGRELSLDCTLLSTVIRGMQPGCARHADLRPRLGGVLVARTYAAQAVLLAAVAAPLAPRAPSVVCFGAAVLATGVWWVRGAALLVLLQAAHTAAAALVFYAVLVRLIDTYPTYVRCTAHGLMLSVTYLVAAAIRGVGEGGPEISCLICAVLALAAAGLAMRIR